MYFLESLAHEDRNIQRHDSRSHAKFMVSVLLMRRNGEALASPHHRLTTLSLCLKLAACVPLRVAKRATNKTGSHGCQRNLEEPEGRSRRAKPLGQRTAPPLRNVPWQLKERRTRICLRFAESLMSTRLHHSHWSCRDKRLPHGCVNPGLMLARFPHILRLVVLQLLVIVRRMRLPMTTTLTLRQKRPRKAARTPSHHWSPLNRNQGQANPAHGNWGNLGVPERLHRHPKPFPYHHSPRTCRHYTAQRSLEGWEGPRRLRPLTRRHKGTNQSLRTTPQIQGQRRRARLMQTSQKSRKLSKKRIL